MGYRPEAGEAPALGGAPTPPRGGTPDARTSRAGLSVSHARALRLRSGPRRRQRLARLVSLFLERAGLLPTAFGRCPTAGMSDLG